MVSLTLTISGLRDTRTTDNETQMLHIPSGTEVVKLSFKLPTALYSRYSVGLRTLSGEKIWTRGDIKSRRVNSGAILGLNVPAKQFKNGTYNLVLSGNNARD